MRRCEFCNEVLSQGICQSCGSVKYRGAASFIYGVTEKDKYPCETYLTDKYVIVRKRSNASFVGQSAAAVGGVVGALIAEGVHKNMASGFGYYPLANIQSAIYPYRTDKIKNNLAIKFINKDNTDFILLFNKNGLTSGIFVKKFIKALISSGMLIDSGLNRKYGKVYCENPFVNINTFGNYRYVEKK